MNAIAVTSGLCMKMVLVDVDLMNKPSVVNEPASFAKMIAHQGATTRPLTSLVAAPPAM